MGLGVDVGGARTLRRAGNFQSHHSFLKYPNQEFSKSE
jgi:hypothetical protein